MTLEPITIHQLDGLAAKAVEEGENARRDAGFKLYED